MCVDGTAEREAAGIGEFPTQLTVSDLEIASASFFFPLDGGAILVKIAGLKAGETTVTWKVGVALLGLDVEVNTCGKLEGN